MSIFYRQRNARARGPLKRTLCAVCGRDVACRPVRTMDPGHARRGYVAPVPHGVPECDGAREWQDRIDPGERP